MYTYKTMMSPKCLHLYFTSCLNFRKNKGRLRFNLYDKRYVFKHPLKLFLWSTILVAPPFEIYIYPGWYDITGLAFPLKMFLILAWGCSLTEIYYLIDCLCLMPLLVLLWAILGFWFLRGAREPLTFRKKTGNPCQ